MSKGVSLLPVCVKPGGPGLALRGFCWRSELQGEPGWYQLWGGTSVHRAGLASHGMIALLEVCPPGTQSSAGFPVGSEGSKPKMQRDM